MPPRSTDAPGKQQRHRRILAALAEDPTVRISALAAAFTVSTETVRRDIEELSRAGQVRRTYGGASVVHAGLQPAVAQRDRMAVAERSRIGAAAAALVEPGAVLMIDAGSTTTHAARALAAREWQGTVITNSLAVAEVLAIAPAVRVLLCPGEFYATERAVYGAETIGFLHRFNADMALVGASGLTPEGPSDAESRAAWVKRAMLDRAARRALLVDAGKFGKGHLERIAALEVLTDLVTDSPLPAELARAVQRAGLLLTLAAAIAVPPGAAAA